MTKKHFNFTGVLIFSLLSSFNINLGIIGVASMETNTENLLRQNLFNDYDTSIRPVFNQSDNVKMEIGIEIRGLESFNQVSETIEISAWTTMRWIDNMLVWNTSQYNIDSLKINTQDIWMPDLELYNAASKPNVYNIRDDLVLYHDGTLLYKRPVVFSFLCPLNLKDFPYDEQTCMMEFGSWMLSKDYLSIQPFTENSIIVNNDFSHNEWNIKGTRTEYVENTYKCCPGEYWPVTMFYITMGRNHHKYSLIIHMNILLTITAIVVSSIKFKLYRRTYILVFIPLSVIWLIQSISSKIPVISYFTKMDKILLTSFIVCEILAASSGIFYCMFQEFYSLVQRLFTKKQFNFRIPLNLYNYLIFIDYKDVKSKYEIAKKNYIYRYLKLIDKLFKLCIFIAYVITVGVLLNN